MEEFAEGFGITFVGGRDIGYEFSLRGAIIAGKAYGDTTRVQKDTSIHANFFPHHLGDTWVYYVHNGVGDDTLQAKIISDSTDSKGNAYIRYALKTHKTNDPPTYYWFEYQKIDTEGNVFFGDNDTYSLLQYKANAQLDEQWFTGHDIAYLHEILEKTVLGVTTTVKVIGHKVGTEGYGESYANGFGISSRTGSYAIAGELYLIAANIGGKKYGDTTLTSVPNSQFQNIPAIFQLFQNYPNPFNPSTIISYQLSITNYINLKVYDVLGREIRTLVDGMQESGVHTINLSGSNLSSGVYFYRLSAEAFAQTKKLVVVK